MASYSTSEFRGGLKIMLDGDPCAIIENEFVKPGKGQAFNRVKIRNLITGQEIKKTPGIAARGFSIPTLLCPDWWQRRSVGRC